MKIIDNKKDYYDYLSGIYGIDNLIVYDRRGSVPISPDCFSLKGAEYFFSQRILPFDKPITRKNCWELKSFAKRKLAEKTKKRSYSKSWTEGDIYHFILEVGNTHYRFEIERWLDEKQPERLHVETTLLDTIKNVKQRYSSAPICIITCRAEYYWWHHEVRWKDTNGRIENPILANTFIPKLIPPDEIWQALYDYLSSLKDTPITDSRTDEQKLESAGFDKKTSFRNVK